MPKKHLIVSLAIALFFCSCTTILNSKYTKIKINAPENTKVVFNEQNIDQEDKQTVIFPKRSKDSLRFSLKNDSITTGFAFKRRLSGTYFLNFYNYGVGFLIDLTNERRFTYKRNLYFKIDSTTNQFLISKDKTKPFKQHTFFIYTSPLKPLDVFSQPMLTIGAEYFFKDNMSFSAEYGTVFTDRLGVKTDFKVVKEKGKSFRYEFKYYNLVSISSNPTVNEYIGLEARFVHYKFNDDIRYTSVNEDISYHVNEIMAVQKSLDIFNIKYGLNYPIGKRFYLDLYFGIGYRIRTLKNPNRRYNPETDRLYDDENHYSFRRLNLEGVNDGKTLNVTLGFKLGIKF